MGNSPVTGAWKITQEFGENRTQYNSGKGHSGRDYATPTGTPVLAVEDGRVLLADDSARFPGAPDASATHSDYAARLYFLKGGAGKAVAISHDDHGYTSTSSHLSEIHVRPGQQVRRGQVIGLSGWTGTVVPPDARGAHLHFEILPHPYQWANGYYGRVHPGRYITGTGREISTQSSTPKDGNPVSKAYQHITHYDARNVSARSYFGYPKTPTAVTIHHWGNDGQDFDAVCHYLANVSTNTSAHTVLMDGKIATLAPPEVATWHAGSGAGNGSSIGVECRPEMTPGDVDTLVQYLYELEDTYGSLAIYFHKEWSATACPGRYEQIRADVIDRVNTMRENGGTDPRLSSRSTKTAPQSSKVEVKAPLPKAPAKPAEKTARQLNPEGWAVWSYRNPKIESRDAYAILRGLATDVKTIKADVAKLKENA